MISLTGTEEPEVSESKRTPIHRAVAWYREFQRFLLDEPSLQTISNIFGGEAMLSLSEADILRLHTKAVGFFHRTRDPKLSEAFTRIVDAFARLPAAGASDTPATTRIVSALNECGHADYQKLGTDRTSILRSHFEDGPLVPSDALLKAEQATPARSADILRQDLNLAYVQRSRLLRAPGLMELATEPALLDVLRRYLGAPPILADISAWRSFAGEDGAKDARDAQLFHFDLDNYRFCKLFVYLTDVDAASGPHIYVPTTHRLDVITARRPADGAPDQQEFDSWYYDRIRKTDEEVAHWMAVKPIALTGKAGTRFLVDTKGLHRGCPPADRDRWVLQFVYGITPATVWFENHRPPYFTNWDGTPYRTQSALARYCLQTLFPGT